MKIIIYFLTAVVIVCIATKDCGKTGCGNDCGMVGKWGNELGSIVIFTSCKDGQIDGIYNTAVGNASDYYVLTGRYTLSGPKSNVVEVGWVVSWNNKAYGNSNSTTTWNGIYYPEDGIIHTQWIFTRYTELRNLWTASILNHDEFSRVC